LSTANTFPASSTSHRTTRRVRTKDDYQHDYSLSRAAHYFLRRRRLRVKPGMGSVSLDCELHRDDGRERRTYANDCGGRRNTLRGWR